MNDTENQTTERPVYLLGETLLSIYLAFRLASAGENPVIVTPPKTNRPDKVDITIKEAQTLKKHKFTYTTAAYTFSPGKMLLITSPSISFKSELMLLSPRSLAASPIVIFSPLHDISVAETLLGKSLIRGCFDGWLQNGNQTVSVLGDTPRISLVKNYTGLEACLASLSLLHRTGLECQTTENGPRPFGNISRYRLWAQYSRPIISKIFSILPKTKKNSAKSECLPPNCPPWPAAKGPNSSLKTSSTPCSIFRCTILFRPKASIPPPSANLTAITAR